MPIPRRNWPCPEGVSSHEVRGHFREERRQQCDAEQENDPDYGCGDDGAAEMIQAAGREIRARSRRETEIHGLLLPTFPPAPALPVGRAQAQPSPCGSGRKSEKCCGRQGKNVS